MTFLFGPPPLTPPRKGEGKLPRALFSALEVPLPESPFPLWGGVRGGGIGAWRPQR